MQTRHVSEHDPNISIETRVEVKITEVCCNNVTTVVFTSDGAGRRVVYEWPIVRAEAIHAVVKSTGEVIKNITRTLTTPFAHLSSDGDATD